MIIFYTYSYNNNKGESHSLLNKAAAAYMEYRSGRLHIGTMVSAAVVHSDNGQDEKELIPAADIRNIEVRPEALGEAARLTADLRTYGEFGKPYIPGFAPFSISHSGNTWAILFVDSDAEDHGAKAKQAASGMQGGCGLDIQYERKANAVSIAERFFAPEDADIVRSSMTSGEGLREGEGAGSEFFRLWTRREALIKAIGSSVAATDIPAVSCDTAEYRGASYRIIDIELPADPGESDPHKARLHAAIAIEQGI